ncbi:cation transporter [Spongorhabdus nitratireducens]
MAVIHFFMAVTLYVVRRVKQLPNARYPFGQAAFEPLLLTVESIILLALCITLAVQAVQLLLNGGVKLKYSVAIGYEAAGLVTGLLMYLGLKTVGMKLGSQLVLFEAQEWLLDMTLSGIALVGFAAPMLFPKHSAMASLTDPVLTLALCLPLMYFPLRCFRQNIRQLLWHAAPSTVHQVICTLLARMATEQSIALGTDISVVVIGRSLWVSVPLGGSKVMPPQAQLLSLQSKMEQQLQDDFRGYRLHLVVA